MTLTELDTLIEKYEENRWIDCAWDDLNDEKEFETIMKYLKENKQLKEKLEKIEKRFNYLKSLQSEDMSAEHYQEYTILKTILEEKP